MPDTQPAAPFARRLLWLARENPDQVRWIGAVVGIFLLIYFLPAGTARFDNAVLEGIRLTHWYAREHVILCLLPAFVIAGAMACVIYRFRIPVATGEGNSIRAFRAMRPIMTRNYDALSGYAQAQRTGILRPLILPWASCASALSAYSVLTATKA